MVSANREMVVYCFDTLVAHYNKELPPPPDFEEGHHALDSELTYCPPVLSHARRINKKQGIVVFEQGPHISVSCPLFVTWKKATNGSEPRLRGCIGSLEARGLINGFKDYALASALRDRRFSPIQAKELPYLECTVSILTNYETAQDYLEWEIGKHGLIIELTDPSKNSRHSATYLPEVAAHEGWTKVETIDSLMRKAGYNGTINEPLRKNLRVTRYQSTLFTMHYGEYASYVKGTRGAAPAINGAPIINGFKPNH